MWKFLKDIFEGVGRFDSDDSVVHVGESLRSAELVGTLRVDINPSEEEEKEQAVSILNTIIKDVESIPGKLEAELKKIEGVAPTIDSLALGTLTWAGPVLVQIVKIEGGPVAADAVSIGISEAIQVLTVAKEVLGTIGSTGSFAALVQGVQTDLQDILTAAKVTNPKSIALLTLVVKALNALVEAVGVETKAA